MTDYLAVSRDESRFGRRVGRRNGLEPEEIESLSGWHTTCAMARLHPGSDVGGPIRVPWTMLHSHLRPKLMRQMVPFWNNPVVVRFPSWIRNRKVEMRALQLRLTVRR